MSRRTLFCLNGPSATQGNCPSPPPRLHVLRQLPVPGQATSGSNFDLPNRVNTGMHVTCPDKRTSTICCLTCPRPVLAACPLLAGPLSGAVMQTMFTAYRPLNSAGLTYAAFLQAAASLTKQLRANVLLMLAQTAMHVSVRQGRLHALHVW